MSHHAIAGASLALSLVAHAWLLHESAAGKAMPRRASPPAFVQLTALAPKQPAPAEPAPPPPALPKPAARPAKPPSEARPAAPEPPARTPEAPSEAAPPELTGTTLTSEQGDGWLAPAGSGSAREGAPSTGPGLQRGSSVSTEQRPARPPPAPDALPLSQLSKKPAPPPLTAALQRNYPPAARSIGQSGDASVRARIEASGSLQLVTIVTASSSSFGDACRRTLLASKWSAPLDRAGKPVATWITYRCKFRIDD